MGVHCACFTFALGGTEPKMCVSLFLEPRRFLFNAAERVVGFSSRRVGFDLGQQRAQRGPTCHVDSAVTRLHLPLLMRCVAVLYFSAWRARPSFSFHIANRTVPSSRQTWTDLQKACRQSHKALTEPSFDCSDESESVQERLVN